MSGSVLKGSDSFLMLHMQSGRRGRETGLIGIRCNFGNCFGSWWLTVQKRQARHLPRKTLTQTRWACRHKNFPWPLCAKIIEADQLLKVVGRETAQGPKDREMSDVVIVKWYYNNWLYPYDVVRSRISLNRTLSFIVTFKDTTSVLLFISQKNDCACNLESDIINLSALCKMGCCYSKIDMTINNLNLG